MHDRTRAALCELVQQHGSELWRDTDRFFSLMIRACPGFAIDIAMLNNAVLEKVPDDLKALPANGKWSEVSPAFLGRLGVINYSEAVWVLELWALALGKLSRKELTPTPTASPEAPDVDQGLGTNGWLWGTLAFTVAVYCFNGWLVGGVIGGQLQGERGQWFGGLIGVALTPPAYMLLARSRLIAERLSYLLLTFSSVVTITTTVALMWSWGGLLGAIIGGGLASIVTLPAMLLGTLSIGLLFRFRFRESWQTCQFMLFGFVVAVLIAVALDDWPGWVGGGACGFVILRIGYGCVDAWDVREDRPVNIVPRPVGLSLLVVALAGGLCGLIGWWLGTHFLKAADAAQPNSFYLDLAYQDRRVAMGLIYLTLGAGLLVPAFVVACYVARRTSQPILLTDGLIGHSGAVHAVAFSPDGTQIVTAGHDRTLRLWDSKTRQPIAQLTDHEGPVTGVAWLPDGKHLVSVSVDNTLRLWDVQERKATRVISIPGERPQRIALAISHTGDLAATATEKEPIRLWNLATGQQQHALPASALTLAFASTGQLLVSGGKDGKLHLWNPRKGKELATMEGHSGAITGIAFVDREILVSVGQDRVLRVWSVGVRLEIDELFGDVFPYTCVAVHSFGVAFAGCEDGRVHVWEEGEDRPDAERGVGEPTKRVEAIALAPDGSKLATAHSDGIVRLWPLPDAESEESPDEKPDK